MQIEPLEFLILGMFCFKGYFGKGEFQKKRVGRLGMCFFLVDVGIAVFRD